MAKSKKAIGSVSRTKAPWTDPDDAPALGAKFFARAKLNKAGQPVRGRPKSESPKEAISLRLDPDVVRAYKSKGAGWQTAINASLRKAIGLPATRKAAKRTAK